VAAAEQAVATQIAACPETHDPAQTAIFAHALNWRPRNALTSPEPLLPLFSDAIATAGTEDKLKLAVARAGLVSHGLALAHTHTRLNAAQLRQRHPASVWALPIRPRTRHIAALCSRQSTRRSTRSNLCRSISARCSPSRRPPQG